MSGIFHSLSRPTQVSIVEIQLFGDLSIVNRRVIASKQLTIIILESLLPLFPFLRCILNVKVLFEHERTK